MQAKPYTISIGTTCRPHITLTSPSWLPRILLTYLFSLVCTSPQEERRILLSSTEARTVAFMDIGKIDFVLVVRIHLDY
jgi:hypothetical protein